MHKEPQAKNTRRPAGSLLFLAVALLLALTLLSVWLIAKYTTSDNRGNDARVAGSGVKTFELWEHEAKVQDDGSYSLDPDQVVEKNDYSKVYAKMEIPKDPFVRLELQDAEVDYELYVRVTESSGFPASVSYELSDLWKKVEGQEGVYKYTGYFDAGSNYNQDIRILKDDTLHVGEGYGNETFSLAFEAWLVQVD